MSCQTLRPSRTDRSATLTPRTLGILVSALLDETLKLNIRTQNDLPQEELRKHQIARLAMEELVGPERARKAIEWKQRDHYTAVYALVLSLRKRVENVMNRHGVKW